MNPTPLIRAYKPTDRTTIIELLRLNTPHYFAPEEEKDLLYYLDHEIEYYFVIETDGKVVGSGGINFSDDPTTGKISWDILHPEHQGKSLGSTLLKYRIGKLKEFEKLEKIIVRTTQLVYRFYEKNGFKITDVVENYWAEGFHLYRMEYSELNR
jgi:ribosomal-protein-alanine N-acetyltransferase